MIHGVEVQADPPVVSNEETAYGEDGDNNNKNDDNDDNDNSNEKIWQRVARRVASRPRSYLLWGLAASLVLSVIGMVAGKFSVGAETGGWQSRGTSIADRSAQVLLVEMNREYIYDGGEAAWTDLINNIQPGYDAESDDSNDNKRKTNTGDSSNRRLASSFGSIPISSFLSQASTSVGSNALGHGYHRTRTMPFTMTSDLRRRLEEKSHLMPGCDFGWYNSESMTNSSRLWPIWEVKSSKSALDADIIYELCVAEEDTQSILEEKGHCFGCDEGCLPPLSIVLYARLALTSDDGLSMSCAALRDAWGPYEAKTKQEWITCVTDFDTDYDPETKTIPASCPDHFSSAMVNFDYDETGVVSYTSSIFATYSDDDTLEDMFDDVDKYADGSGGVSGVYDTQKEDFVDLYADGALTSDMALAMASAVIVAIAIMVHTRSPFITLIGLVQIMFSFPLSFFVYSLILGLEFFPFLNFLGMFVIFGLGADDVFVAMDKWKNARLDHPNVSTEDIAAMALPDAASAMFLTTVTTAVAFFATAICPVAPVKMFAIFCGLLVLLDYFLNVLLVFPALCMYDIAIQEKGDQVHCCIHSNHCCNLCCRKNGGDNDNEADPETSSQREDKAERNGDSLHDSNNDAVDHGEHEHEDSSLIRRALLGLFHILKRGKWPIFALSMIALVVTAIFAAQLDLPTSSDVRVLGDDVEFEQAYSWRQELLYDQLDRAEGSVAYIIWGVKPADTGNHNDPDEWTRVVLDKTFDPGTQESQQHLLDICSNTFAQDFADPIGSNYTCSFSGLNQWLVDESSAASPSQIYQDNCAGADKLPMPSDSFHGCMTAWAREVEDLNVMSRNGRVTIFLIPFNSRVRYDDDYDTLDDEWNLIDDWMKEQNKEHASEGTNKAFFSSADFWWYDTNGQMLKTAYGSVGIALAAATIMLLATSRSLLLTLFSTTTVAYVLSSVTASLVSLGWTLGFLESICFAILIGISCDFVLHFAHAYTTMEGDVHREERTKFAILHMGPSILAAGFTTVASAAVMNFTVITFFQKFGLILLIAVIQATIGAFIVFNTLVICFGPKNPSKMYDALKEKCSSGNRDPSPTNKDGDSSDTNSEEAKHIDTNTKTHASHSY